MSRLDLEGTMTGMTELSNIILESINHLRDKDKREVLNFIEYLKIKEDRSFIEYVNKRTKESMKAKQSGERFVSLRELQRDYA